MIGDTRCMPYPGPLERHFGSGLVVCGPARARVFRERSRWRVSVTLGDARESAFCRSFTGRKADALDAVEAILGVVVAGGANRCAIGPRARELADELRLRGVEPPDLNDVALVELRAGVGVLAPGPEICSGEIYASTLGPGPWYDSEAPDRPGPAGLDRALRGEDLCAAGYFADLGRWHCVTREPREFYGPPGYPTWAQQNTCSGDVALSMTLDPDYTRGV